MSVICRKVGLESANKVASVISRSFTVSPISSYFLRERDSTWPGNKVPYELIMEHFKESIPEKMKLGGEAAEAGDFAAVAMWFPPSMAIAGEDDDENERIHKFALQTEHVRNRWLQGRKFWYLNLIGRHPDRNEKGVVRALIEPYLIKAREDGVPAWLEAVDEHSRDVYAHFGFKVVEKMLLGAGEFNRMGEFEDGGEGVKLYGMLFE